MDYEIKVNMYPHEWDNKSAPYFWMISKEGCNEGFGWSETPEKAWKDALEYYQHIKEAFDNNKGDVTEELYIKLMNAYIRETADSDGQLFCGCRREDCTDYMCYSECRKCLERYLKEDF